MHHTNLTRQFNEQQLPGSALWVTLLMDPKMGKKIFHNKQIAKQRWDEKPWWQHLCQHHWVRWWQAQEAWGMALVVDYLMVTPMPAPTPPALAPTSTCLMWTPQDGLSTLTLWRHMTFFWNSKNIPFQATQICSRSIALCENKKMRHF